MLQAFVGKEHTYRNYPWDLDSGDTVLGQCRIPSTVKLIMVTKSQMVFSFSSHLQKNPHKICLTTFQLKVFTQLKKLNIQWFRACFFFKLGGKMNTFLDLSTFQSRVRKQMQLWSTKDVKIFFSFLCQRKFKKKLHAQRKREIRKTRKIVATLFFYDIHSARA